MKDKRDYKNKIEGKFDTDDMASVWKDMHIMSGRTKFTSENDNYTDEINTFYGRFDCHNSREWHQVYDLQHQELYQCRSHDPYV